MNFPPPKTIHHSFVDYLAAIVSEKRKGHTLLSADAPEDKTIGFVVDETNDYHIVSIKVIKEVRPGNPKVRWAAQRLGLDPGVLPDVRTATSRAALLRLPLVEPELPSGWDDWPLGGPA